MGLRCCLKIGLTGLGPYLPVHVSSTWRLMGSIAHLCLPGSLLLPFPPISLLFLILSLSPSLHCFHTTPPISSGGNIGLDWKTITKYKLETI